MNRRVDDVRTRKYVVVGFLLTFTDWVSTTLINMEIYRLTESPTTMALFRFFLFVPPFIIGGLVLNLSKKIGSNNQLTICLVGIGLANIGVGAAYFLGLKGLWTLAFYYLTYGTIMAFYRPVNSAFAAEISSKGEEAGTLLLKSIAGQILSLIHI